MYGSFVSYKGSYHKFLKQEISSELPTILFDEVLQDFPSIYRGAISLGVHHLASDCQQGKRWDVHL